MTQDTTVTSSGGSRSANHKLHSSYGKHVRCTAHISHPFVLGILGLAVLIGFLYWPGPSITSAIDEPRKPIPSPAQFTRTTNATGQARTQRSATSSLNHRTPSGNQRLRTKGDGKQTSTIITLQWGNPRRLLLEIDSVWSYVRPNPLFITHGRFRNNTPLNQPGSPSGIAIVTRGRRLILVSQNRESLETLRQLILAFQPTPVMGSAKLYLRQYDELEALNVSQKIQNALNHPRSFTQGPMSPSTTLQTKSPRAFSSKISKATLRDLPRNDPLDDLSVISPQQVRLFVDIESNSLIYQASSIAIGILDRALDHLEEIHEPSNDTSKKKTPEEKTSTDENVAKNTSDVIRTTGSESVSSPVPEGTPRIIQQPSVTPSPYQQAPHLRDIILPPPQPSPFPSNAVSNPLESSTSPRSDSEIPRENRTHKANPAGWTDQENGNELRQIKLPAYKREDALSKVRQNNALDPDLEAAPNNPFDTPRRTEIQAIPQSTDESLLMRGLTGDVEIQSIPELGIFLIEGADEDVLEVQRVIAEIERISEGRAAVIEILPLKHVQAESLATLVNQIYQQLLESRGLVPSDASLTAAISLVKPNALLLIGPRDDMDFLIEQANRLDQPVDPDTQFRTFRLKHAPATLLQTAIEEFYDTDDDSQGLGTKVTAIAESRSNSLVVRASPRDMLEIETWISKIDVPDTSSVNDLQIFALRNAVAEDLAQILQQAILGVLTPASNLGGVGGAGNAIPGALAAPSGQSGSTDLLQRPTSSVLRFSVPNGEKGSRDVVSGILSDVRINADPRSNSLIVSAPQKSMTLIEHLIQQLDTIPSAVAEIRAFTLLNGDAASVSELLTELFQQDNTQQDGLQTLLPVAGGEDPGSALIPLRFSVDRRTNTIIAIGSANDLLNVHSIIIRLDQTDVNKRNNKVIRLKHSPAQDIANAIDEFLQADRDVEQDVDDELISAFEQIEREVVVVAEPVNNFILISATTRYFDEIIKLINELDERPPMVAIQVLIAEVELGDHDEFGLELGLQDSLLFDRSLVTDITTISSSVTGESGITQTVDSIVAATLNPGFNFNNQPLGNSGSDTALRRSDAIAAQGLSNFSLGRINNEVGFGGLLMSVGSENLSVLLRALKQTRRVDVLSRPQIVTLDNQAGFVQVGEQVPTITGSTLAAAGGQTNNVEFRDVGLILQVLPRISPDGTVTMLVDTTKSQVGNESDGIPVTISATGEVVRSPRIDITTAQTVISARDGQTVVLGGLLSKSTGTLERRVPYLSDIPIIGNAFRYDLETESRTELLIILTPRILKDDKSLSELKQLETSRMSWILSDVENLHGEIGITVKQPESEPSKQTKVEDSTSSVETAETADETNATETTPSSKSNNPETNPEDDLNHLPSVSYLIDDTSGKQQLAPSVLYLKGRLNTPHKTEGARSESEVNSERSFESFKTRNALSSPLESAIP